MADYWLATSLEILRAELNTLYPTRDKRSDGWIGDKYHAGGKSDHNPSQWPPRWAGVVRAFDVDNDLGPGANGQTLVNHLVPMMGKHPALMAGAYLIYNGRIISTDRLREGWRKYSGKNPHTGHVHISVSYAESGYNSIVSWGLGTVPAGTARSTHHLNYGDDMTIYLFDENGRTVAILAHNGAFAKIAYQPKPVPKGQPKSEYQNLLEAGAKEVWLNPTTVAALIADARGANRL